MTRAVGQALRAIAAGSALLAAAAAGASAQRVAGRVVKPNGENPLPVPRAWVVLHRIGHESAGPLDSMRTDAGGAYSFRYARAEDDSALYLVSSVYGGVAYFTPPVRAGDVRGQAAEIMVFDTTSALLPLRVQGRHLVVGTAPAGRRNHDVLEVYELSNDTTLTAVAPGSGRPVWTALVPERAEAFRIGEGDVSEGGLVLRSGRAELVAPVAPGLKQISFRYELPPDAFPLRIPITQDVGVLEVVVDDPGARVTGTGLREMPPVTAEGRTFKRFLAQDVHENTVVTIDLATGADVSRGATVAALGALFAAGAAGALALAIRRGRPKPSPAAPPARESEGLIRAIADLDARFESTPDAAAGSRAAYEAERHALKERLRAALARGPGRA